VEAVNFTFFEGPAGTGKTCALIRELASLLKRQPLKEGQRVLGLTYMHGARRRLEERLQKAEGLSGRFVCTTVDSFAWHLLYRRRTLARELHGDVDELVATDFETVCQHAASLLAKETVRRWLGRAYPIVIVDELQDIKQGRLDILKELSPAVSFIGAADEFQDLFETGPNTAVAWARSLCKPVPLLHCHRTEQLSLLEAAKLLRSGQAVPQKINSRFQVLKPMNANVGASFVASNLHWYGATNTVILSPTKQENSTFVHDVIKRLKGAPIKPSRIGKDIGPYNVVWEADQAGEESALFDALGLHGDSETVVATAQLHFERDIRGASALEEYLEKRRRLVGQLSFSLGDLRTESSRVLQRLRSRSSRNFRGTAAMTIHQAKNREFQNVIILWPVEVAGKPESLRRLLYNGVTRAKSRVLVIVHSPPDKKGQVKDRLASPPFSK
jgi:superfamily I DNA/RNA helicase